MNKINKLRGMSMSAYIVEGFSLGLTLAGSCLATCGPIYAPVLLMEKRTFLKNLFIVLEITAGRFLTYALFGAIAGYFGQQIPDEYREWLTGSSYVVLSVLLIYMVIPKKNVDHATCPHKKMAGVGKRYPFWLGVVTGISICPSFLLALSQAVDLAGIWQGMLFFIAFFGGTTLVILPMAFLGFLPNWRLDYVKKIGIILTIPVALWFGYRGIVKIKDIVIQPELVAFTEASNVYIINEGKFDSLSLALAKQLSLNVKKIIKIDEDALKESKINKMITKSHIIRLRSYNLSTDQKNELKTLVEKQNIYLVDFYIHNNSGISYADTIYNYLDYYRFKVKNAGFYFIFGDDN